MIVVIGSVRLRASGADAEAAGLASAIAVGAAAENARVEVIARLGDDPAGDAVLLALARHRVGHVAVLRDAGSVTEVIADPDDEAAPDTDATDGGTPTTRGPALEAADADLALRYLPEMDVIVAVHLDAAVLGQALAAASWAETSLIVVVAPGTGVPPGLPVDAVTLELDDSDDSSAGRAIGRYAAALDRGEAARDAYDALIASMSG
ncbi:MAG TPA: hypothetical protein VF253_02035 [Candidatus Limnocylindrales bacterium]